MIPYEFSKSVNERRSWYEVPEEERPTNTTIDLHRILHREQEEQGFTGDSSAILSREAKDRLFRSLDYRAKAKSPTYKRNGWAFDFRPALNRYVVVLKHYGSQIYYAPDKTSIRNSDYTTGIREIYEIPNKVAEEYRGYREHNETEIPVA
jgi:hypothetical protein